MDRSPTSMPCAPFQRQVAVGSTDRYPTRPPCMPHTQQLVADTTDRCTTRPPSVPCSRLGVVNATDRCTTRPPSLPRRLLSVAAGTDRWRTRPSCVHLSADASGSVSTWYATHAIAANNDSDRHSISTSCMSNQPASTARSTDLSPTSSIPLTYGLPTSAASTPATPACGMRAPKRYKFRCGRCQ